MLLVALVVLILVLAPDDAPLAPEPRWATAEEIAWLRGLQRWDERLSEAADRLDVIERDESAFRRLIDSEDANVQGDYVLALADFGRCRDALDALGEPPTRRLQETARRLHDVCELWEWHAELLLDLVAHSDAGVLDQALDLYSDGERRLEAAWGALTPGEHQPLPVVGGVAYRSRTEPALSRVASRLAEKEVRARCWSARDWSRLIQEETALDDELGVDTYGFAWPGGKVVHLSPRVCTALVALRYRRDRSTEILRQAELALALGTLAHESMHSSGIRDEAKAECYAVQLVERAAWGLGVNPSYSEILSDVYWDDYPEQPSKYVSKQCRNGGKLDLRPTTSDFP